MLNFLLTYKILKLLLQVCYLLRELEAARGNMIPLHDIPDNLAADVKTSAEV